MYRNILIPVAHDHSAHEDAALAVARALRAPDAAIHLLHVMEPIPSYVSTYVPEEIRSQNRDEIVEMLAVLAQRLEPGAQVHLVAGHPGRRIVDFAIAEKIDLIIMASHRPELSDYLIGSTAAYVVRHAGCAVHVLR